MLATLSLGLITQLAAAPVYAQQEACESNGGSYDPDTRQCILSSSEDDCPANGGVWQASSNECILPPGATRSGCNHGRLLLGFPTWYQYLDTELDSSGRCQPIIDGITSVLSIGVAVLDIMLRLAGILAVAFIIVGAFKYIISGGEPDRAKSARNTIINALVGLVITLVATGIVTFIGDRFGES